MDNVHKLAETHMSAEIDFSAMLQALVRPQAFPYVIPDERAISLIQTHASAVILTPEQVYKLKKPGDFGFFNYSTPVHRRQYCLREVQLNMPLAPGVYLGVAPVLTNQDHSFWFGPTFSPETNELPRPGERCVGGLVVDYAVVMTRLPEEATLEARVRAGTATPSLLRGVAHSLAAFHVTAETNDAIAHFGSLPVIRANWEENMAQMKPYVGRTLTKAIYERIVAYGQGFLQARAPLFASRIAEQRIRDGHGDMRLQHVYLLDQAVNGLSQQTRFVLLDRIEFNDRFRYEDVASEVAFLTMELEAASRADLARTFVDAYVAETNDESLRELLPFYLCYRACVRGKVSSFQLEETEIPEAQRKLASRLASELFALAGHYARGPVKPLLVMVGGLMGTGKSMVTRALHQETGWVSVSSDMLRKQLAGLDPTQPQPEAFGRGIYSPSWTRRTYEALCSQAREALACGRSVLLDASFGEQSARQLMGRLAAEQRATALFVECKSPRAITLRRLEERWNRRIAGEQPAAGSASSASDGRGELYDAQAACWEPFCSQEEALIHYLAVTTALPVAVTVEQVLEKVGNVRLACWLTSS